MLVLILLILNLVVLLFGLLVLVLDLVVLLVLLCLFTFLSSFSTVSVIDQLPISQEYFASFDLWQITLEMEDGQQ
eukprot:COSAG04_NODE_175_length_21521_cov_167.404071_3_plen_75_part_00